MTVDLDALEKLANAFDSGTYSTSGAMARTYGAGGKIRAAQDIKALIAELKEARGMLGIILEHPFAEECQECAMGQSSAFQAARAFLAKAQGGE